MNGNPRTLTDAVNAIREHIDNGHAVNVDQAAARAIEQHRADRTEADAHPGSAAPEPR